MPAPIRPLLALAAVALVGCAGRDATPTLAVASTPPADGVPATRQAWSPPVDWRELSTVAFEQLLAEQLPLGAVHPPSRSALDELGDALAAGSRVATRSALLLARTGHPAAHDLLLARLEARVAGPDRDDDAGDCTAASALALGPLATEAAPRLAQLAVGATPHPDLEVRTECAAAALTLGRDEVIAFLLAVLRIDTPEAARRGERLTESPTTAWARGRAAEALCARAGIAHVLWTDAPIAERERRALELESLLLDRGGR